MPHILIIDAPYYTHISKGLRDGAEAVLKKQGATFDYVAVPGVLEIPAALSMASDAATMREAVEEEGPLYDGYVLLGCVIRGETTHYDIVAFESARVIMDIIVQDGLCVGNGIQTTENEEQALARAMPDKLDKGGHAAQAVLDMIKLREKFFG